MMNYDDTFSLVSLELHVEAGGHITIQLHGQSPAILQDETALIESFSDELLASLSIPCAVHKLRARIRKSDSSSV